ncbi:noncanonical pyrimidine nucleotidase, YjjG family [Labilibaculum manganireducens]|uniref:Noncanonical pyrimidine nucleotidase, YjjG family n=1 Tax=Labilibaculum manganireducens TaxID=1940525 RepID=A0A2N3HWH7_9BACT|nr:YjjG family noncanonical pyrimidine nucleotidase [Labilibaculum manganireducens]PKQ62391.1 noncanonical pyrimidine nucleotidase, YjjG family [Labilibaculum manganireducens]
MTNLKYQHIFFDLDRTLWDFNKNSEASLNLLFRDYQLQSIFGSFLFFKSRYEYHNGKLWNAYYQNRIKKEDLMYRRFYLTLKEAGLDDLVLAKEIANDFIEISPLQTATFPNTHQILEYLKNKGYQLYIITNGFIEVQAKKLKNSKLDSYFMEVITSEDAGANKPTQQIFEYAFKMAGACAKNSIMIGDDLSTDIAGAKKVQMDQIYFNPHKINHKDEPTFEINDLSEIKRIL